MSNRTGIWMIGAVIAGLAVAAACTGPTSASGSESEAEGAGVATFAGGCFWCMEPAFEKLDGVTSVVSGYTGGKEDEPSYTQVSSGRTGHTEAVQVRYDPETVDYRSLLDVFWRQIDPTDAGGQFADRGSQYRTGIFFHDDEQRRLAEETKAELGRSGPFEGSIVTEITPAGPFFPAEEYHQDYYKKNPTHYKAYRKGSGREGFLARVWGAESSRAIRKDVPGSEQKARYAKAGEEELRSKLSPLQYRVTQEDGTERAFSNEYWNNSAAGIYVDIVSGEPLFSSRDKFKSGTGWPSFTRPLAPENVVEQKDANPYQSWPEVRSKHADSHLGHVFPDGPAPTGLRYCINSASLRFVPAEDLEREGYSEFRPLFEDAAGSD